MYMAETLTRMKKEDNVCLFEKDSRFGGRNFDFRFSQAPNISIGKALLYNNNFSFLTQTKIHKMQKSS